MSVDYFPCSYCQETICDALPHTQCANCEDIFCEYCYPKQKRKYGLGDKKAKDYYGDDVLKECDNCSKKTLKKRIKEKEKELADLKALDK